MEFDKDDYKVNNAHGTGVAESRREKNLYLLNVNVRKENVNVAKSSNERAIVWHQILGHLNIASLMKLEKMVNGMNLKEELCTMCVKLALKANIKGQFFPKYEVTRASKLLELVHNNIYGPLKTASCGGARYFVTFIDDFLKKNSCLPF